MKKMINHQIVYESTKFITVDIRNPFWSAGQRYGWGDTIPGFGISEDIIKYAREKGKKIEVKHKEDRYSITISKIDECIGKYEAFFPISERIMLWVIPRSAFTKLVPEEETKVDMNKAFSQMPDSIRDQIRLKLGLRGGEQIERQ